MWADKPVFSYFTENPEKCKENKGFPQILHLFDCVSEKGLIK